MLKHVLWGAFILICSSFFAQSVVTQDTLKPEEQYENVFVKNLHQSADASSFLIWVKDEVPAHYHEHHIEHVYIIEGTGIMLLRDELLEIKAGDVIILPQGTVHAVKRTGEKPLKVLSVQSPQFKGEDRVSAQSPVWRAKHQKSGGNEQGY